MDHNKTNENKNFLVIAGIEGKGPDAADRIFNLYLKTAYYN